MILTLALHLDEAKGNLIAGRRCHYRYKQKNSKEPAEMDGMDGMDLCLAFFLKIMSQCTSYYVIPLCAPDPSCSCGWLLWHRREWHLEVLPTWHQADIRLTSGWHQGSHHIYHWSITPMVAICLDLPSLSCYTSHTTKSSQLLIYPVNRNSMKQPCVQSTQKPRPWVF